MAALLPALAREIPMLPAALSEDELAAFHEDESAALVEDRRRGSTLSAADC